MDWQRQTLIAGWLKGTKTIFLRVRLSTTMQACFGVDRKDAFRRCTRFMDASITWLAPSRMAASTGTRPGTGVFQP